MPANRFLRASDGRILPKPKAKTPAPQAELYQTPETLARQFARVDKTCVSSDKSRFLPGPGFLDL